MTAVRKKKKKGQVLYLFVITVEIKLAHKYSSYLMILLALPVFVYK